MDVAREFSWIGVYQCDQCDIVYKLEKILYDNNIPCQVKADGIWTPLKYEDVAKAVVINALNNNLDKGILYEQKPLTLQDKIVIDHSYEVKIPTKIFWLVMMITFSPMLYIFISQVFR